MKEKVVGDYENIMNENINQDDQIDEEEHIQIMKIKEKIALNDLDKFYIKN